MLGLEIDDGDAFWSEKYESVDLRGIPLWDNGEPSESMSSACAVAKGQNGLALQSCNHRLPFVCKYHACLKGKISQVFTQIQFQNDSAPTRISGCTSTITLYGDTGLDEQNLTVNIFLPINLNICFGYSKELSH